MQNFKEISKNFFFKLSLFFLVSLVYPPEDAPSPEFTFFSPRSKNIVYSLNTTNSAFSLWKLTKNKPILVIFFFFFF